MIKTYYKLIKPGIIFGNLVTCIGGFILASKGEINALLLLAAAGGLSLIIASGCVFNNYIDRDADAKMERTRERALVKQTISAPHALIFALILGCAGAAILALFTNLLTLLIALIGFVIYVTAYSLLKYHSTHATLVGAVAGATPPVVGYCAVTGRLDAAALILFAILFLWQMPHFYAIAIYRFQDYAAASIPVLPIRKGVPATRAQIVIYATIFALTTPLLTLFGYTGYLYLAVTSLAALIWLVLCLRKQADEKLWARRVFLFSLPVVTLFSLMISLNV
ncbi:MAG: protoheme IX farnesyltransferase [Chlamydiales bacterium]|nr:protoheme IX farnesyltransferase [Chlamydiales bacterium]